MSIHVVLDRDLFKYIILDIHLLKKNRRALCPVACEIDDFLPIDPFSPSPKSPSPGAPGTTKILLIMVVAAPSIDLGAMLKSPDKRVCMHAFCYF